jgi:hypothetical protein
VRIGVFYTPPLYEKALTPEERFVQDIVLGRSRTARRPSRSF